LFTQRGAVAGERFGGEQAERWESEIDVRDDRIGVPELLGDGTAHEGSLRACFMITAVSTGLMMTVSGVSVKQ